MEKEREMRREEKVLAWAKACRLVCRGTPGEHDRRVATCQTAKCKPKPLRIGIGIGIGIWNSRNSGIWNPGIGILGILEWINGKLHHPIFIIIIITHHVNK